MKAISSIRPGDLAEGLRGAAGMLAEEASKIAPVGSASRSSRYRVRKDGTRLSHPGVLRDSHVSVRRGDKIVVQIDARSEARQYGILVHEGQKGRGKNDWMSRSLTQNKDKIVRRAHQDITPILKKLTKLS